MFWVLPFFNPNSGILSRDGSYETEWWMSKIGSYWKRLNYVRRNDENSISNVVIRLKFFRPAS